MLNISNFQYRFAAWFHICSYYLTWNGTSEQYKLREDKFGAFLFRRMERKRAEAPLERLED
jgi:hypothetical protein